MLVRGRNVTTGYWRDPSSTADVLSDGWYATGDLGRIDTAGNLQLLGRKRDMIALPSGLNVFPSDVESELLRERDVVSAAVVGWSTTGTPAVHAVLIPASPGADVTEVIRRANSRLAPHQRITGWTIWPDSELPQTSTRKVRRAEILQRLDQRAQTTRQPSNAEVQSSRGSLVSLLASVSGRPTSSISHDTDLTTELGLDSLARVELAVTIEERLGVAVSDEAIGQSQTVVDLERLIADSRGDAPAAERPSVWPRATWAVQVRRALQSCVLFPLLNRLCRPLEIEGLSQLESIRGPVLIVANHSSHLDAALVLRSLPARLRRRVAVAAAQDYFFTSPWRSVPAQLFLGAFPLARTGPVLASLEECGRMIDRGWSVLVFPEGTRSPNGQLQPFKAGIGLLARELRVPVVPVALRGAFDCLPKGRLLPCPGRVRIAIGQSMTASEEHSDQELARRFHDRIAKLLG